MKKTADKLPPRDFRRDPLPGDRLRGRSGIRTVDKVFLHRVWYHKENGRIGAVSRSAWMKWAATAKPFAPEPLPFKPGDLVTTDFHGNRTEGPYRVVDCVRGAFGSGYGVRAEPVYPTCSHCGRPAPRMPEHAIDGAWFKPVTVADKAKASPEQLQPDAEGSTASRRTTVTEVLVQSGATTGDRPLRYLRPKITLCGKWLEDAGFTPRTPVRVEVFDGRLVLSAAGPSK